MKIGFAIIYFCWLPGNWFQSPGLCPSLKQSFSDRVLPLLLRLRLINSVGRNVGVMLVLCHCLWLVFPVMHLELTTKGVRNTYRFVILSDIF